MHAVALATLPVSAASGLVEADGVLWVIADDGTHLAGFDVAGLAPRPLIALLDEVWPEEHAARKRQKADLEALCAIGDGRLLALGSGSRPNRCRGVAVDVRSGAREIVELGPLYAAIGLPDLNIEGAARLGGRLRLLQRGNGAGAVNAVIDVDPITLTLRAVRRVELGALEGVRWGFTDASPLGDGRLLFSAAAESGDDVYRDGQCLDSALGVLAEDGTVEWLRPLGRPGVKIEGVHARGDRAWLVSDADDATQPTTLYEVTWG
jgi:hypothetical protein